ncbi:DUF4247 domain-containing protein [Virgibacillus necropolis]|uniref:DUF4247 domain-containing protein n=2 Tax=Virgibacillus necropolis TaxID=163877 RepID=A0A221MI73_9BACI|nr:DUF4247 domain-containing protein [Virgibacillus necropolis]
MIIATGCSSPFSNDKGIQEEVEITANDIPEEPSKDEIINKIKNNSSNDIDDIIEANFPLMDVVQADSNSAEIYATKRFELSELASVLTETIEPDEKSEVKDNQQIFIYPDEFVTLKVSEDDNDALIIEVAEDEFVRRNYSPSFLGTYFAFRLLDNVFGVNDWNRRRSQECRSGNCYGGYTGGGYGTPNRGDTSFRGGGPGSGK